MSMEKKEKILVNNPSFVIKFNQKWGDLKSGGE